MRLPLNNEAPTAVKTINDRALPRLLKGMMSAFHNARQRTNGNQITDEEVEREIVKLDVNRVLAAIDRLTDDEVEREIVKLDVNRVLAAIDRLTSPTIGTE